MKNVLIISTTEEEMLSNVNDGTNRLFINGSEIPSSEWVGTGNYTATVEGHAVTIAKADTLDGNISLARTGDYTYEMRKRTPSSGTGVESIVQTTTSHEDGGVNIVTCTLTDGTETDFEIRNGQKGSTGAAAGFGTPTASVDANIGTPSVTVTASGADTAKVFDFAFHNLKGEYANVDNALSNTSENPVQNKVITAALDAVDEDVEHPYVMSSDIAYNPDLKKLTSTKTTSTWGDSQVASNCGYVNDVFLTAKPNQTNAQIIFGLDSNPNQAATYSDIDYAWYVESGRTYIYESGTLVTVPSAYRYFSAGTELKVEYSGVKVRYYHNGSLVRTVARSLGSPLYMNIMFKTAGALYDVDFGVGIGKNVVALSMPAGVGKTVTYAPTASQWAFLASAEAWATASYQLTYVKGYATASRSNIIDLAKDSAGCFTVTGSSSDKTYTFTNKTNMAYEIDIIEFN